MCQTPATAISFDLHGNRTRDKLAPLYRGGTLRLRGSQPGVETGFNPQHSAVHTLVSLSRGLPDLVSEEASSFPYFLFLPLSQAILQGSQRCWWAGKGGLEQSRSALSQGQVDPGTSPGLEGPRHSGAQGTMTSDISQK